MRLFIFWAPAIILIGLAFLPVDVNATEKRWTQETDIIQGIGLFDAERAPRCTTKTPLLTTLSLGPVQTGQSLRQLEMVCPILHYGWYWPEGDPTPVVLLRLGEAVLMVEFSDEAPADHSKIWRITTKSPVRTVDGFGPGSLVSDMIKAWGKPSFGVGECELFVWFPARKGLSFEVILPSTGNWDCFTKSRLQDAAFLPKDTRVGEVQLFMPEPLSPQLDDSGKFSEDSAVSSP